MVFVISLYRDFITVPIASGIRINITRELAMDMVFTEIPGKKKGSISGR